jgi:tRNA pseudouridine13 synthase
MFNEVLSRRVADGSWCEIRLGDLAKKREGALFSVGEADLEDARDRARRGLISPTGPLFGASMRWPEGVVRALEEEVLAASGLDEAKLVAARHLGEGTRRALRLEVDELETFDAAGGVGVSFVLPKGGYATTVLAEACALVEERATAEATAEEA